MWPSCYETDLPLSATDPIWTERGKNSSGIIAEDVEALVKYAWSSEQTLYQSPQGKGGFNYAGSAHPEYFNTQYYAQSLYPVDTPSQRRRNAWYGSTILTEADAGGDGRHLLLSWTSQVHGGLDNGLYEICLAKVEFDSFPEQPQATSTASSTAVSTPITSETPADAQEPTNTPQNMVPNNGAAGKSFLASGRQTGYEFLTVFWGMGLVGGTMLAAHHLSQ